jgi:hypothetical protein
VVSGGGGGGTAGGSGSEAAGGGALGVPAIGAPALGAAAAGAPLLGVPPTIARAGVPVLPPLVPIRLPLEPVATGRRITTTTTLRGGAVTVVCVATCSAAVSGRGRAVDAPANGLVMTELMATVAAIDVPAIAMRVARARGLRRERRHRNSFIAQSTFQVTRRTPPSTLASHTILR